MAITQSDGYILDACIVVGCTGIGWVIKKLNHLEVKVARIEAKLEAVLGPRGRITGK